VSAALQLLLYPESESTPTGGIPQPKADPLVSIRQSEYLALLKLAAKARLVDALSLQDEVDTLLRIWGER
jgi:hypothetical protein